MRDLFAAFTGKPLIDRPDKAALQDNPLAIPGFRCLAAVADRKPVAALDLVAG